MKRFLTVLMGMLLVMPLLVSAPANAGSDQAVTFEFMLGFGPTSKGNKGFAFRYQRDQVEGHLAHWWGKSKNTAIGLGFVADTEGSGTKGNEDWHASLTGGVSYVFNIDPLLGPPELSTSPFVKHFQPFFRGAVGRDVTGDGDLELELSYSRYGFRVGERFVGFGLRHNNRFDNEDRPLATTAQGDSDGNGEEPPPPNDDDGNNGHGDDENCFDDTNPGGSEGCPR